MLYLSDIRDWLKEFNLFENYYIGKLDNKKEKSLGVYCRKTSAAPIRAIGNRSTYEIKPISLLIHYTSNSQETEKAAFKLYEQLEAASLRTININGTCIYISALLQPEPIDVGTDDSGIYERVIELDLYYERSK